MRIRVVLAGIAVVAAFAVAWLRCRADDADEPPRAHEPVSRGRLRLAELRRQPPGSIRGRVTLAGAPVDAAMVCAREVRETATPACTTTDAAGAYVLAELEPGRYIAWAASARRGAAGRHGDELSIAAGRALVDVDIRLAAGAARVTGVVRDVRARPIGGALVHVATDSRAPPAFTTWSEPDGTFVAYAPAGEVHASASADGFVDGGARATAPGGELVIELLPESAIAGVVIDARTREPLADALVSIGGTTARTHTGGEFRIAKLSPGRYKPSATTIGGYGEAPESVLVPLGRAVDGIVIEIHPVAVVAGRLVVDEPGGEKPCGRDRGDVTLLRYGSRVGYTGRTDDDGDVLLEGVVPGTYEVTAGCRGTVAQLPYPDLVVHDSDVDDVVWHVAPGARIRGSVRARDGKPIEGAVVAHRAASGASWGQATTGADGTFVADGLAPGASELDVSADGYPRPAKRPTVVAALDAIASVDIVLPRGGRIVGEVVDETGAPVAGVGVQARGDPGYGGATTDANGRFEIVELAAGAYDVEASSRWGRDKSVETTVVIDATARVHLVSEVPRGEITGVVVDTTGAPVVDAYVAIAREDDRDDAAHPSRGGWQGSVLAGLDGSFRLTGLPRGIFALRASRENGSGVIVDRVAVGSHARITMHAGGVIAGVVVPSGGRSIDDVTISAVDRDREVSREERLYHTAGRFALRDLPAGTYRLTVDEDPRSVVTITLADGERREDLRLVAQPRYTVRGRLVTRAGAPLANWTVEAPRLYRDDHRADGSTVTVSTIETAVTTAEGRFLVRDLPAGPLVISAADLAHHPEQQTRTVHQLVLQGATDVDVGDIVVEEHHD